MTDITRLISSLKRRSAHAKEFGHDVLFVKLEDLDALVEALEKAQQLATQQGNIACALFDEVTAQRQRIAELEESNAQVIQSRDHYQRMSEEGLKQLAESCAVSVESFTCPRCGRTTTHPEGWHYCHKREAE
ncbi:TPA: hypothetical protein ACGR6F_001000 [Klebsiella aerogenes]|uniref:hypothetical protein n=1 Tax=Klebsiella aerogenes TaxID=548 RepID=UPI000B0DB12E|nr:hypothetical protein [Klebsiella aerogenes]AXY31202.1 hypothetical protein CEQ05_24050 [Klebsiella aerogenes]EKZ6348284.1 hypothetical protein [Klebsiella aerogenes]MEB6107644.1 hypothetical protein [Klebsiella aerogenes]HBQ2464195.1 hypothetical protein [Klebsiella aerogenes]HDU4781168.1 hypothetical protein [Klebsiella aerogenes]